MNTRQEHFQDDEDLQEEKEMEKIEDEPFLEEQLRTIFASKSRPYGQLLGYPPGKALSALGSLSHWQGNSAVWASRCTPEGALERLQ